MQEEGSKLLEKERKQSKLNSEELSKILYGGSEALARKRNLEKIIFNDPVFSKRDNYFLSRVEYYERGLLKANRLATILKNNPNLSQSDGGILWDAVDENLPLTLHHVMFIPALQGQADEEQQKKWLPDCWSYKVIGTYAQTELGHGSNVKGLETTATYDERTNEFVIHSPTLTSIKWWPGNLAKTANHVVIVAQLIIHGKNYGVHNFLLQIRDFGTHKVRPGITVGDIGPKFGINMVDNGFLKLNNVRIPRGNMLMRFSRVEKGGKYVKAPHSKLSYGTMVFVRASVVNTSFKYIARAATIAVRYSVVRRQFSSSKDSPETQIIEYQTQQNKIFPLIAVAYGMFFVGSKMMEMYHMNNEKLKNGDVSLLPELHALSSSWKALTTEISSKGIEESRKSLGGHGYLMFSGMIHMFQNWVPSQTYEGENTILYLQTARFLLKTLQNSMLGKPIAGSVAYFELSRLNEKEICRATNVEYFFDQRNLLNAYEHRSRRMLITAAKLVQEKISSGMKAKHAMDSISIDLVQCARAHALLKFMQTYHEAVEKLPESTPDLKYVKIVQSKLLALLACHFIEIESGDFLFDGYMTGKQIQLISLYHRNLLKEIRSDVVPLVDAFDFSDHLLNSALGRFDGNVYQTLFDWAQESPLNKSEIAPGVEKYLLPIMKDGRQVQMASRL